MLSHSPSDIITYFKDVMTKLMNYDKIVINKRRSYSMDEQRCLLFIIIGVMVLLRLLISFMRYVLQNVSEPQLENMADTFEEKAEKLLGILDNKDQVDVTLKSAKLLMTLIITGCSALLFEVQYLWIVLLVVWLTIVIFTEILPQMIAKGNPEKYGLGWVTIISVTLIVLKPLTWIIYLVSSFWRLFFRADKKSTFSEQELLNIVEKAQSEGSLEKQEGDLIRRSIEFNELDVYSILTPRVDVVAINYDWDLDRMKQVIEESEFSRLPVYKSSIDTVIGVIHAKDFHKMIEKNQTFDSIIKPVVFTPTYYEVSKLLRQFQLNKSHIAVVVDEYGGTAGIVTLEDIIEELVGEIWDEHDDVELDITTINPVQYLVSGGADLDNFFLTFNVEIEDENEYDSTTVGGWVLDEMNKIPSVGEQLHFQHLLITVMEADDRRVYRIMVNIEQNIKESEQDE